MSFALLCPSARRAIAQDPGPSAAAKEQARALYDRGTTEYHLGYFEAAAKLYEQSYRLLPDPALLFDVGQSYRFAGQRDKALVAYKSYLRTSVPDAPARDRVRKLIDQLEATATTAAVATPLSLGRADMPVGPPLLVGAPAIDERSRASTRRWWLWGTIGAVVAGGVTTALILAGRPRDPMSGSVGVAEVP